MRPITLPTNLPLPGVTAEETAFVKALAIKKRESVAFAVKRLRSLRDTGKHVYRNTVTAKVKSDRRARAKVAKASRKVNR